MSVNTPSQLFNDIMYRTNEIIWWNRQLSKLDNPLYFVNYEEFILNDLVETKGPFIEYVRPSEVCTRPIGDFLNSLGYNPIAIEAFSEVLFNGDQSFHLYWHQSEALRLIDESSDPLVLSVPTATGKTEAFLFPLLNYCLTCNENGLKGLIIYPTKTLEVDQLNRFVRYLDQINERTGVQRKITIGIWDGDTPFTVGYNVQSGEIPVGSYLRGLECPKCREKLQINENKILECDTHGPYTWLRAIRSEIRKGVDILISNPEALDFQYVSPDKNTQSILGEVSGKSPLKYIVLDEAHVWTGITGAGIQLLIKRLMNFFSANNPNLILLSATISDPHYLGVKLSGKAKVNVVNFKAKSYPVIGVPDFSRIAPCSLPELLQSLLYIRYRSTNLVNLSSSLPNFTNCLEMLKLLDLVERENTLSLTKIGLDLTNCINQPTGDVLLDAEEIATLFLESDRFQEVWCEILSEKLPEISVIASFFPKTKDKPSFATLKNLVESIVSYSALSKEKAELVLQTCLNLGRPANLLIDKYHYFIKPPRLLFWCEECKLLSTKDICSKCGQVLAEIKLCKTCHLPYYATGTPIDQSINMPDNKKCPNCSSRLNLISPNVPYSTLVTFLASTITRKLPSKKVLLFSDSRRTAENIGSDMLRNDYSLVAQQLIVRILLDNNKSILSQQLSLDLLEELKERYYYYLYNHVDRYDDVSQSIISQILESSIRPLTYLSNNDRLFNESIITPKTVLSFTQPLYNILAHEIHSYLLKRRAFQLQTVKVPGLTPKRISKSLTRRLPHLKMQNLDQVVTEILIKFHEDGVIENLKLQDVYVGFQDNSIEKSRIEYIKEDLETELLEINTYNFSERLSSPLFKYNIRFNYYLNLVETITYCQQCYSSWPVSSSGAIICPKCGGTLSDESRWSNGNEGRLAYQSSTGYYIDHWGNDIVHEAYKHSLKELPSVAVGVNRAGIPSSLRGIIEEGFRNKEPKINIISTTPVMELGIDIGTLDVVCQIGVPPTISNYVQRSGRAGRAQGRSSIIISVVRGDHPIDSYYFDRLEAFLLSDDELNIPDPYKFETVLDSHVATEVMGYLARNPDPRDVYRKAFSNPSRSGNAGQLSTAVIRRIKAFAQLSSQIKRSELETHVNSVFGSKGLETYNRIFQGTSEKSLIKKVEDTYGRLNNIRNAEVNPNEQQRYLSNWMSRLGLLANYRGSINQLPLSLEKRRGSSTLEFKPINYAIRENYPGPCDKDGAIFSVETTKYIVRSATGLNNRLLSGKMCTTHEGCAFPYKVYSTIEECPFCSSQLEDIEVYELGAIITRSARRMGDNFTTYPHITTNVKLENPGPSQPLSFFGLNSEIFFSRMKVVTFTAAFEKRYRGRTKITIHPSKGRINKEGFIDDDIDPIDALLGDDVDDCHYVGYSMNTYGVTVEINNDLIVHRIEEKGIIDETSLTSLLQAFKRAVCIVIQCELQDFEMDFYADDEKLQLYVYDAREGGNNISDRIYDDLTGSKRIFRELGNIANCQYCSKFCDRCLMIERTPSYMVEKGLLDRNRIKRLLSV